MIELEKTNYRNAVFSNAVERLYRAGTLTESHMQLLSALESGWTVGRVELVPSGDQHGLIYRVTLQRPDDRDSQQLILARNWTTEVLLSGAKMRSASSHPLSQPYLWYG